MSKTLFRYIFWDLLWKFMLASGALSGIMSFGGILRPLTKQGLGLAETLSVLFSLMPAMSTYSFPIAALFATTLVYGRLSADNEIVAMRAGGISYASAAKPAFLLGLIVAMASVCALCFVVPVMLRNVERTIYSNAGRILATEIERTHEFSVEKGWPTLSAQGARLLPPDPAEPGVQTVVLDSPLIVNSKLIEQPDKTRLAIPKEFLTARKATIKIRSLKETEQVEFVVFLENGMAFPRHPESANIGGFRTTIFKPEPFSSTITEKTKFMDLSRLHELYFSPDTDRRVKETVLDVNRTLQQLFVYGNVAQELTSQGTYTFDETNGTRHTLTAKPGFTYDQSGSKESSLRLIPAPGTTLHFETRQAGSVSGASTLVDAKSATLLVTPNPATKQVEFEFTFAGASVKTGPNERPTERDTFPRSFTMPAPPQVVDISTRSAVSHKADAQLPPKLISKLSRALIQTHNEVIGELNARMSLAISCLVLVLMGVALGMMFKSGNYLTAFAVSVGPALLCILLTVTGQHTLENIPREITDHWVNPLGIGLAMIWTGNVVVLITALGLLYRLQKQ